jgi:hypothetical protein
MERNDLKSLYDLLAEGYTVAQLATAVETHGVLGWDRYGRFDHFKPRSDGAQLALDALAEFFTYEAEYFQRRDYESRLQPGEPADMTSAIESIDQGGSLLEAFGWPPEALPAIDPQTASSPRPPIQRKRHETTSALIALGGLLECLSEYRDKGHPMTMPSESVLIDKMLTKFPSTKYVKKGSLGDIFADAKRAIASSS